MLTVSAPPTLDLQEVPAPLRSAGMYLGNVARWFVPTGCGRCVSRVDEGVSSDASRSRAGHLQPRSARLSLTTAASPSTNGASRPPRGRAARASLGPPGGVQHADRRWLDVNPPPAPERVHTGASARLARHRGSTSRPGYRRQRFRPELLRGHARSRHVLPTTFQTPPQPCDRSVMLDHQRTGRLVRVRGKESLVGRPDLDSDHKATYRYSAVSPTVIWLHPTAS